jgi:16S rRNA (uracil1498-N3)-methyltransferase
MRRGMREGGRERYHMGPAAENRAMAHVARCLVDDLQPDEIALSREALHHLRDVLRLRAGEPLELVDGRGGLAHALLAGDLARVQRREPHAPPDGRPVTLAVAAPRLPRLEWLVEKACELGVAELVPLLTRHGERGVSASRLPRLQRIADEALLQCGRLHRMRVHAPAGLPDVLARPRPGQLWLASPPRSGAAPPPRVGERGVLACVGPEGGFRDDEQRLLLDAGATPVSVGRTILRVETAALALAALAAV